MALTVAGTGLPQCTVGERLVSARFAEFLARAVHADRVSNLSPRTVSGGSSHQTWRVSFAWYSGSLQGQQEIGLRCAAERHIPGRLSLLEEAAVMRTVCDAGIPAPDPLAYCAEPDLLGAPFLMMSWLKGTPETSTTDNGIHAQLRSLASSVAQLHCLTPDRDGIRFLNESAMLVEDVRLLRFRVMSSGAGGELPELATAVKWLEKHEPGTEARVLTHGDLGMGNVMFADGGVSGILDWEFTHACDRHRDIGSIWAKAWRRNQWGARDRLSALERSFADAYRDAGGNEVDEIATRWWEVRSHVTFSAGVLNRFWRKRPLAAIWILGRTGVTARLRSLLG